MRSIKTRITLAVVGCTALAVAIAAVAVALAGRTMLLDALDERLVGRARWFAVMPRWNNGPEAPAIPPRVTAALENGAARDGSSTAGNSGSTSGNSSGSEPTAAGERGSGERREGRGDGRGGNGALPFTRNTPSSDFWFLVHDAADRYEVSRYGELPDGLSLANLGVKAGDPPVDVDLEDGRTLRVYAFASVTIGRIWPRPPEPSATPVATPPAEGDKEKTDNGGSGSAGNSGSKPAGDGAPRGFGDGSREDRRPAITWLALDATEVHAEARRLVWLLAAAWAGATLLAFAAARAAARAVLKPVASLSQTIASLSPQDLSERVPMEEVPAELSLMTTRLNNMLQRVESAFERERATIANLAHELRTPLSALRTELEFSQFRSETRPEDQRTIEKSLALALRMQSLVSSLLTMSRIESGQEPLERREIDAARIVREAWGTVEARARERGLVLRWSGLDEAKFESSPAHVAMVASNLLDNAVSHGAAGDVEVRLDRRSDGVQLTVSNRCDHADQRPQLSFEPFWRSDPSRTGERHFGIGLALCDRVVRLLGGTIGAKQDEGRFRVTVQLPAAA
jgi:signal transduction histidine kinase